MMVLYVEVMGGRFVRLLLCGTAAAALLFGAAPAGRAAFYNDYEFHPEKQHQTSIRGLLNSTYPNLDKDRGIVFFQERLKEWTENPPPGEETVDIASTRAYLLFRVGRTRESDELWGRLVREHPDRWEVASSWATALMLQQRFDEAVPLLEHSTQQKPGFRSSADELQLEFARFMAAQKANPAAGAGRLWHAGLHETWKGRGEAPGMGAAPYPAGLKAQGVIELARQFPNDGAIWLAVAIALEREKSYREAALAYKRAVRLGNPFPNEVRAYDAAYALWVDAQNPVRRVGWAVVRLVLLIVVLLFGAWFLRVVTRFRAERQAALAEREYERAKRSASRGGRGDGAGGR